MGTLIGIVFFLVSATTLFSIMQNSINFIWRVKVKSSLKKGILKVLKDRLFSFGVILSLGFLLLVSLIVDAVIGYMKDFLNNYVHPDLIFIAQIANILISLVVVTMIFVLIYRFLPDVNIKWSAAWFGGIITALLFSGGKYLIGLVIGSSNVGAVYGAIGSFIGILIWIYYAAFIFYFGVELSRQFSIFYQHNNSAAKYTVPFEITTEENHST
jgi:membrane protein